MSGVDPSAVPHNCPGTESENAGKSSACAGCPNQQACQEAPKGPDPDVEVITKRMESIKHKILVLSGKGGVGKSTFSSQLSFAFAAGDAQVGLLDIDICGPSIPKIVGLEGEQIHSSSMGWSPVYVHDNLAVMSVGFLLSNPDDAVIWRGPKKNGSLLLPLCTHPRQQFSPPSLTAEHFFFPSRLDQTVPKRRFLGGVRLLDHRHTAGHF